MKETKKRLFGLDALRVFAIVGVVLYHLIPSVMPGGFLGVPIFFTLMGFLMVYTTKDADTFSPITYLKKKVLRLYPELIITLLISVVLLVILVPGYPKGIFSEVLSVLLGYNNWYQVVQNGSYFTRITNSSPFTHLWYMGLTIQYYILWPLVMMGLVKMKKAGMHLRQNTLLVITSVLCVLSAVLMAVLYSPEADPSRIYYGTDTRAYSLLLGMLIAQLPLEKIESWMDQYEQKVPKLRWIVFGVLCAVMLVMYFLLDGTSAINYRGMMQLFNLFAGALLILVLISQDTIGKVLEHPVLKVVGKQSYIVYLVMYPVIYFVNHLVQDGGSVLWVIVTLLLIVLMTYVVYRINQYLRVKFRRTLKAVKKNGKRRYIRTYRTAVLVLLAMTLVVSGSQSVYRMFNQPADDTELLQKELEENRKRIEEQEQQMQKEQEEEPVVEEPAEEESQDEIVEEEPEEVDLSISAIGDSVMLGAFVELADAIPEIYVDAAESRQVYAAFDIIQADDAAGKIGHTVIIHLGTNGPFNESEGQKIIDYLGKDRVIYWMNCYGKNISWQSQVNATIQTLAENNKNVTYVDWAAAGSQHPEWFYSDGIHLNGEGRYGYAEFVLSFTGRTRPVPEPEEPEVVIPQEEVQSSETEETIETEG